MLTADTKGKEAQTGLQVDLPFEAPPQVDEVKAFEKADDEVVVEKPRFDAEKQPDVDALKRQVEELTRSEKLAVEAAERSRAEREAAIVDRDALDASLRRTQLSAEQAQLETIETAIGAAQTEAETAQRDIALAVDMGDGKAQAEAYRRLARAESYLGRLEDGKAEIEQKVRVTKINAERPVERKEKTNTVEAMIDNMNVPERGKEWLREHPEYMADQRKNVKLQAAHWDAVEQGHKAFSTDYFIAVEKLVGLRREEVREPEDTIEEREVVRPVTYERTPIVSAPVSREVPNGGPPKSQTRVRLTRDEAEAAKSAGITDAEYARQKMKIERMKADGSYGG